MTSNVFDKYSLALDDFTNLGSTFDKERPIHIEIGFGTGSHLIHKAQYDSEINFIGIDLFLNGLVNVVEHAERNKMRNVKVSREDARHIVQVLPDNSIAMIYILFPDPWPKNRHSSRRLIQKELVDDLYRVLHNNGSLVIATDHDGYKEWIIDIMARSSFTKAMLEGQETPQDIPLNWFTTKYQERAIQEKRACYFYQFIKKV